MGDIVRTATIYDAEWPAGEIPHRLHHDSDRHLHIVYPAHIAIPDIRMISINGIEITLQREAGGASVVMVGSANPEDGHSAWKSDRQTIEFQLYDRAGPIGDRIQFAMQLGGRGSNGTPFELLTPNIDVEFGKVTDIRLLNHSFGAWMQDGPQN